MNQLQRFVLVRRRQHGTDVIGTNSGQAFVAAAAEKHKARLEELVGGSYTVVEIGQLRTYIEANALPTEEE
jgi:hypothetical protein